MTRIWTAPCPDLSELAQSVAKADFSTEFCLNPTIITSSHHINGLEDKRINLEDEYVFDLW